MAQMSIGDLSNSYWNQINNRRLKINMQNLCQELTTGKVSNLHDATGGDFRNLANLESDLKNLNSYKVSAAEAALFAETTQRSLTSIQDLTSEASSALMLAASSDSESIVQVTTADARSQFSSIVSVLNSQIGNRALFAGTETGTNPLISAEEMLAEIKILVATETTALGVQTAVSSWFDSPGGGFETIAYQGSDDSLAPFRIGPNETAGLKLRADSQGIRDLLKGYTLAALVADGALAGNPSERLDMTRNAANQLMTSDDSITEIRSNVGSIEARIESARSRNNSEMSSIEIARSNIISSDIYKSATEFQSVQIQLEILYSLTSKLSNLSLANYI